MHPARGRQEPFSVDELCEHFGVAQQVGGRPPEGFRVCGEAPSCSTQLYFSNPKGFLII